MIAVHNVATLQVVSSTARFIRQSFGHRHVSTRYYQTCAVRLIIRPQYVSSTALIYFRASPRRICYRLCPSLLSRSNANHFISRMVQARNMNSSTKSDKPPEFSTIFESLCEGLKYVFNYIRELSFHEICDNILRLSGFIGTVHIMKEYGFTTFTCEGPSMEPTIIDGSYTLVLVERWSLWLFGLESHYDIDSEMYKSESNDVSNIKTEQQEIFQQIRAEWLSILKGVWKQHFTTGLQRGDVIILNHPQREGTLCKRIIGMPGDIIVRTDGGSEESNHRVAVPPGHIWIEGDNSCASVDSRSYGAIPASLTIGKVICRLWPLRDYAWQGIDTNGVHQWRRIGARIGRGERPKPANGSRFLGSHVLGIER